MADFLLVVEPEEILGFDVPVGPEDVPLLRLLGVLNSPTQLLDYRLDDVIMGLCVFRSLLARLTTMVSMSRS